MTNESSESFKGFERSGWEAAHQQYERSFSGLTRQSITFLLNALEIRVGRTLLDAACGPGHLSAAAATVLGGDAVLGVDFATQMIDAAKRNYPSLRFQLGDAENLVEIGDESFDAVAMNYGIMHLGEPERALAEFYRILAPGGRVAFSVWRPPHEARGFEIVRDAVAQYGDPGVAVPAAPDMFYFSEPERCRQILATCGFGEIHIERIEQTWRLPAADMLFAAYFEGTARTGGLLKRQTTAQLEQIRLEVCRQAENWQLAGGIAIPMPAIVASAVKR